MMNKRQLKKRVLQGSSIVTATMGRRIPFVRVAVAKVACRRESLQALMCQDVELRRSESHCVQRGM
jgi:hypothetical protein